MANPLGQLEVLSAHLTELAGGQARDEVMQGLESLGAKTKPAEVAVWVKGAMQRLDEAVNAGTREEIMLRCGRNCALVNQRPIVAVKKRRAKFSSLDEFLAAEESHPPAGMKFERDGDTVYQYYTPRAFSHPMRCFCGLMRALPEGETVSKTYCNCSRGFVQVWWEGVLDHPVKVELLESAISGSDVCKFAIRLK